MAKTRAGPYDVDMSRSEHEDPVRVVSHDARAQVRARRAALILSAFAHVLLVAGPSYVALRGWFGQGARAGERPTTASRSLSDLELPVVIDEEAQGDAPSAAPLRDVPTPRGGDTNAHADTGHAGRGGDGRSPRAIHLADAVDRETLQPDLLNRLDHDQHARIDTKQVSRQAWEDRRASRDPMELAFVSSQHGTVAERRDPGVSHRGAAHAPAPGVVGARRGASSSQDELAARTQVGGAREGGSTSSPGLGERSHPTGQSQSSAATSQFARPSVAEGHPSIPAAMRGKPEDNVDSQQQVATAMRSIVHASVLGGTAGEGQGGDRADGAHGAGGNSGDGSTARVLGAGGVGFFDLDSNDPRTLAYFRMIHGRIDPHVAKAFPKQALLDLKQGFVILEFRVQKSGATSVSWPPVRASGIPEFDQNCADLLRRVSPFPPIPDSIGKDTLVIRARLRVTQPL
jgi:TonB family protein